jgi:hypothetical protein
LDSRRRAASCRATSRRVRWLIVLMVKRPIAPSDDHCVRVEGTDGDSRRSLPPEASLRRVHLSSSC